MTVEFHVLVNHFSQPQIINKSITDSEDKEDIVPCKAGILEIQHHWENDLTRPLFLDYRFMVSQGQAGYQGEIVKDHEESLIDKLFDVASRRVHTIQNSSFVDVDKRHHKSMQTVSEISKT